MTEIVLFHVLAATAGAAFGLLAIWAGLGRHHWSVRFIPVAAVIVAMFPVPAFDLALVFVSQALVVAVPLILVRRFTAPPANKEATVRSLASHSWWRFSVADLFRATLLIAAVFGVVAYLPGDTRASWWKYVLLGIGFGMAALAGTWAALAQQPWWIRLGVMGVTATLAGVPTALDETVYADFRLSTWPWCAVTAAVGVLVAVWLSLTRTAGLTALRRTDQATTRNAATARTVGAFHRRLAGVTVGLVSLVILLPPALAYYDMVHPAPIPPGAPSDPNAYDDLLRIAAALQAIAAPGSGATEARPEPSPAQQRLALLAEAHAVLLRPSVVPIHYDSSEWTGLDLVALRQLARDLQAEGESRRLTGDIGAAQAKYLDLVELGLASSRGGLIVDRLVGIAFEGIGIEGLRMLRGMLTPDERRALVAKLQAHEAGWDPLAAVDARELAWQHRQGWAARIINPTAIHTEGIDQRHFAILRLLICELALSQYIADHGGPPEDLAGLVPKYLPEVPEDPFSGRPLVYREEPAGYVLYSVGQNDVDDGGLRGQGFTDGDLFLDPAPPPRGDGAGDD